MPQCVIKSCKNNYRKHNSANGISYFRFPRDPMVCASWISTIAEARQEEFYSPKKNSVICSIHFEVRDIVGNPHRRRLRNAAVPTLQLERLPSAEIPCVADDKKTKIEVTPAVRKKSKKNAEPLLVADLFRKKLNYCRQIIINKSRKIQHLEAINKRIKRRNTVLRNNIQILKKSLLSKDSQNIVIELDPSHYY